MFLLITLGHGVGPPRADRAGAGLARVVIGSAVRGLGFGLRAGV